MARQKNWLKNPEPQTFTDIHTTTETDNNKMRSKWKIKPITNNTSTVRKLCSVVLQIAVLNIFQQHCYCFYGNIYKQVEGCPIGLKLSGIVARLIMDSWAKTFMATLDRAGMELQLFIKYVDDVNLITRKLSVGTKWNSDKTKLIHDTTTQCQDSGNTKTELQTTYDIVLEAANNIYKYLDFTIDTPEQHHNLRVPMLDLETWVAQYETLEGKPYSQIMYGYYKKTVTSNRVIHAESAYTWRNKTTSLIMEVFRRLRNCSGQMTIDEKTTILEKFLQKLKQSGYKYSTRKNILLSGVTYYFRKLRIELQGGPRMNKICERNGVAKRRIKLGVNQNWFKRRRGGIKGAIRKETDWRITQKHDISTLENTEKRDRKPKPVYNPAKQLTRKPRQTDDNTTRTTNNANTRPHNRTPIHL